MNFGLVGCGAISETHVGAINGGEGRQLVAVCDEVESRAKALGVKHGVAWFSDLSQFLKEVDAVAVCVPSGLHNAVAVAAAREGKHVVVEKPVEVNFAAAVELIEEVERAGVHHACISQHRFAPDILRVKEAIASGEGGKLVQADGYNKWYRSQGYYDSGGWRGTWELDGGGALMNQGVHYLDLLQWIGGGISAVRAITRTAAHQIEVEDTMCALIEFNCGAVGVFQASTAAFPGFAERLEFHCEHGAILIEADRVKVWDIDPDGASAGFYGRGVMQQPAPNVQTMGGEAAPNPLIWGDLHTMQYDDFVTSFEEGRPAAVSCRDALEPLKVILAIYESGRRNGERVSIAEMM